MINLFKKNKNKRVVLATQDYQSFIDSLEEQLRFNTATPSSMFKFGILLGEIIYKVNPDSFEVIEKLKSALTKVQKDNRK